MRGVVVLVLILVGCSSSPRDAPDAAPPDDAPADGPSIPSDPFDRTVNSVLVDGDFIYWTHGRFDCNLEYPCLPEGPSVTMWSRAAGQTSTRYEGGIGARSIVGTADTRFFVAVPELEPMRLMRDRDAPVPFVSPVGAIAGLTLDATYVYWADSMDGVDYTLRRALRTGDGSDATVLSRNVPMSGQHELVHAGGYLWWISYGRVQRVQVSGGRPTTVAPTLPEYPMRLAAYGDTVYVACAPNSSLPSQVTEIGRIDVNGTYTRLVTQEPSHNRWPRMLVATADALYWSRRDGNVYRAPIAGGAIETIAANDQAGYAFAVLPDKILVELTKAGFREIPR